MTKKLTISKTDLINQVQKKMQQHLTFPNWTLEEKVALACRILHAYGHDSGLAGQITARVRGTAYFVTQRMGVGFDETTSTNLIVVDANLNIVDGEGMPSPANRFHARIYDDRPDVQCVIHTHPIQTAALSMLGRPLEIAHMDTCALYGDVAFLSTWPGVPIGIDEGEIISTALGDKRAILLAHHGLLVACRSVEEACVVAIQFERAATLQLLAMASGELQKLQPKLAQEAHDWLLLEKRTQATFHYHARKVLRQFPDCLKCR